MLKDKKVLFVAPHADDEVFGAGGTLLRLKDNGCQIALMLVACSDVYMNHAKRVVTLAERKDEFHRSAGVFSTEEPAVLFYKDTTVSDVPMGDFVRALEVHVRSFCPDVFFLPEPSYHQDHQYVHRACVAALRPTVERLPPMVFAYEVPTSTWSGMQTKFEPNFYFDVSEYFKMKIDTFYDVYRSQHEGEFRNRLAEDGMIQHMKYRGIEAGVEYAEAFMLIRGVQ